MSEKQKHINDYSLDEFLFFNKNRDYGAYVLRRQSKKYSIFALFSGLILSAGIYALLSHTLIRTQDVENFDVRQVAVTITPFSQLEAPPPLIEKTSEPKIIEKVPEVATKKFVKPELKKDDLVQEEDLLPTMEDFKKANPGTITKEGSDDILSEYKPIVVVEDQTPPPPPPPPPKEKKEVLQYAQKLPRFPGGEAAMYAYIQENLKYPPVAAENGISGIVVLQFVVDKDGNITDAEIVRDIGGGCGEEALRVLKSMPTWEPGEHGGKRVNVKYTLPVRFELRNF